MRARSSAAELGREVGARRSSAGARRTGPGRGRAPRSRGSARRPGARAAARAGAGRPGRSASSCRPAGRAPTASRAAAMRSHSSTRQRQRLLAEHVQAGLEAPGRRRRRGRRRAPRRRPRRAPGRAGRASEAWRSGDAVAVADGRPDGRRRIGQRGEIEALALVPEEVGVRGLPDEARPDQPDAQPRPARTHRPSLERCNSRTTIAPAPIRCTCRSVRVARSVADNRAMRVADEAKTTMARAGGAASSARVPARTVHASTPRTGRSYLAAIVAYYAFLSIFPLMLVFVTVLGYALAG